MDIYGQTLEPLIPNILNGFNVTCFAYGMTGAGKTHTMIGELYQEERGLCSLAMQGIYEGISQRNGTSRSNFFTKVSYLEIYNEQVRDLLSDHNT
jgi:hypothetical protein